MNNNIFKVDRNILLFSLKYALGRMTYAPSVVIDNIKFNIDNITTNDIMLYIREIEEVEYFGTQSDKNTWFNFLNYLKNELEKRKQKKQH